MHSDSIELSSLVTQCDKEPIHLLGKVQDHGFMIVLDREGVVSHVSENIGEFLDSSISQLIGSTFWHWLDKEQVHAIRGAQSQAVILGKATYLNGLSLPFSEDKFDLCIHQSAEQLVLEFERVVGRGKFDGVMTALMSQIAIFSEMDELYTGAV